MEEASSSPSSSTSPPLIPNPVASSSSSARESRRRKKKMKTQHQQSQHPNDNISHSQSNKFSWKSESTQQLYSTKFLQALRHVRLTSSSSAAAPRRGRVIRETADRVLATTARGRTRWSWAILINRLRLKFMNKKHKRRRAAAAITGASRSPRKPRLEILKLKGKNLPAMHRKVKMLGKLVPGCQKEPLPVILEEVTDYIPALEMQLRVLTDVLSRFSALSAGTGGDAGEGSSSGGSLPENGSG